MQVYVLQRFPKAFKLHIHISSKLPGEKPGSFHHRNFTSSNKLVPKPEIVKLSFLGVQMVFVIFLYTKITKAQCMLCLNVMSNKLYDPAVDV